MSIRFSHPTGQYIHLWPGRPTRYYGSTASAAHVCHADTDFGRIVVEEISTPYGVYRYLNILWEKAARIVCEYTDGPAVCCRAAQYGTCHEFIKGAGEVHLKEIQFRILSADKWQELLMTDGPEEYHYVDLIWNRSGAHDWSTSEAAAMGGAPKIWPHIPSRWLGPTPSLTSTMKHMLIAMHHAGSRDELITLLRAYRALMIDTFFNADPFERGVSGHDREGIADVKQWLTQQPIEHLTIPQLSRQVGINEFKLKKLFHRLTGFTIDEYRKYHLCLNARDEILSTDRPLKAIFGEAGYSSCPAFVSGFRKYLSCTPGELKTGQWNAERVCKNAPDRDIL